MSKRGHRESAIIDTVERKTAIAMGLKRYFTGAPCPNGHVAERKVCNCGCVMCHLEINKLYRETSGYHRIYYAENANDIKEKRTVYRNSNLDRVKEIDRQSRARNADKRREHYRIYRLEKSDEINSRKRIFYLENAERLKAEERDKRVRAAIKLAVMRETFKQLGITIPEIES